MRAISLPNPDPANGLARGGIDQRECAQGAFNHHAQVARALQGWGSKGVAVLVVLAVLVQPAANRPAPAVSESKARRCNVDMGRDSYFSNFSSGKPWNNCCVIHCARAR